MGRWRSAWFWTRPSRGLAASGSFPALGRLTALWTAGEIRFTGWLELLKALYEVTGAAGPDLPGGA